MFCVGYYGILRVGEMCESAHTLRAKDVHVGDNKEKIMLLLYTSKTHGQESEPQKIRISTEPELKKDVRCPIQMVIKYMRLRGSYELPTEQFFVFADKSSVKPDQLRDVLRKFLDRIHLNSKLYDVHSFRSERTSDLSKFGYSVDQMKAMGHWRSNTVYKYLKN